MALLVQTVLALVMLFSGSFDQVINYLMSQLIVCSMLAVVAVVVLRLTSPDTPRPFRVPLYPLPVILFVAMSLWMLVFQIKRYTVESEWGLVTLVVGAAVYFLISVYERRPHR
jgi:APA family basic amino acid/polyamine antiporter